MKIDKIRTVPISVLRGKNKLILVIVCLIVLSASYAEAIRVFTMQELEEKITNSKVQDVFLTDIGIEGFYDHDGVRSPFIVFGKFEKIPDNIIQLSLKYGVNINLNKTMPQGEKFLAGMIDLENIVSFIYLTILLLILIYLIFINRKLVKIVSMLSQISQNRKGNGKGDGSN